VIRGNRVARGKDALAGIVRHRPHQADHLHGRFKADD